MPGKQVYENPDGAVYTSSHGHPFPEPYEVQRVGRNGPLLLQDFHHIDMIAHFDRERIPERVVHAKGAGGHGYFEVTDDISDLCLAELFSKVGNKVKASMRFSTVGGESGSPDTARDVRGFSVKMRTEEGNWDWVFNNTPVFFLRDPSKFPEFIHTQKRDPQSNLQHLTDPEMFWDYLSSNPEAVHQVTYLFGDRGVPDGYRYLNGYAGNTFKMINKEGKFVYVKIHCKSRRPDGPQPFLTQDKAVELAGSQPDYATQDLFDTLESGTHPEWDCYVQTMTPEQAEGFRYNILDMTKVWSQKELPLRRFGKLVLQENAQNYFAEIEQIAFSPAHLIPGVEPSADPVLQSRLFSYTDTQRYRLGTNYNQLPVNAPLHKPANFQRDGSMAIYNQGPRPNYKSRLQQLSYIKPHYDMSTHEHFLGAALVDLSEVTELDFEQPRDLWRRVYDDEAKERFVKNVSGHMSKVKTASIREDMCAIFAAVDQDMGNRVAQGLGLKGPVKPLKVKPATEATRFTANLPGRSGGIVPGNVVNGVH